MNTIVSGGTFCLPAIILRDSGIRQEAMPFDWLFCNVQSLIYIIQSEFSFFLDKNSISSITNIKGHPCATNSHYDNNNIDRPFFNHKDPTKLTDNEYYKRCIERFMLLKGKKSKIFILDEFGEIDHLYYSLIETLDNHMPGMHAYAVRYHYTTDNSKIITRNSNNGHFLFDFNASKIVSGSHFERESDRDILLNTIMYL